MNQWKIVDSSQTLICTFTKNSRTHRTDQPRIIKFEEREKKMLTSFFLFCLKFKPWIKKPLGSKWSEAKKTCKLHKQANARSQPNCTIFFLFSSSEIAHIWFVVTVDWLSLSRSLIVIGSVVKSTEEKKQQQQQQCTPRFMCANSDSNRSCNSNEKERMKQGILLLDQRLVWRSAKPNSKESQHAKFS